MSVASFVLGILGIVLTLSVYTLALSVKSPFYIFVPLLFSVPGFIVGLIDIRNSKKGNHLDKLSLAGTILSTISILVYVIPFVLSLGMMNVMTVGTRTSSYSRDCVALVNGGKIGIRDYDETVSRYLQSVPDPSNISDEERKKIRRQAFEDLLDQELLFQAGTQDMKIKVSKEDIDNKVRNMFADQTTYESYRSKAPKEWFNILKKNTARNMIIERAKTAISDALSVTDNEWNEKKVEVFQKLRGKDLMPETPTDTDWNIMRNAYTRIKREEYLNTWLIDTRKRADIKYMIDIFQ